MQPLKLDEYVYSVLDVTEVAGNDVCQLRAVRLFRNCRNQLLKREPCLQLLRYCPHPLQSVSPSISAVSTQLASVTEVFASD
jgi:hypothetical protein